MTERLEQFLGRIFTDKSGRKFGDGWISGILSIILAALAICSVLAIHFPEWLTLPELRTRYPLEWVRLAIDVGILVAMLLAGLSMILRRRKVLGVTGLSLSGVALALGAGGAPLGPWENSSIYLGLDWFVLGVLTTATVFVPLEKAFPLRREQGAFRKGWLTDTQYFFMSHASVQLMSLLVLLPITGLGQAVALEPIQDLITQLPLLLQFILCLIVADLTQYWIHRAFHKVPFLWRFHKVHHSVEKMDWIAGSRLHFVDVIITRGVVLLPLVFLGFEELALYAYLGFVSVHAVFIHANFEPRLGWMEEWLVTPRFHHWHHGVEREAVDKNFAVHLPWLDRIFGTIHFPDGTWPKGYGLEGTKVPQGYFNQFVWPLAKSS